MPTPVSLLDVRKFFKNLTRHSSFYSPHYFCRRYIRWSGDQNVHMVFTNNAAQILDLKSFTGLPYKLTHTQGEVSLEHMISIFRDPHKVILDLKFCMTSMTIFHAEGV